MDNNLKELCIEILEQNLNGDRFTNLIIESGIKLDSNEWDVANKILEKADEVSFLLKQNKSYIH